MHFDLAQIPATDAYKLLVSTVVPRPIALATTVDGTGRINAAPFSFFNAVSSVPPVVVLGISPGAASEDGYKDTERISATAVSSSSTSSTRRWRSG
jgi:flavin reductase (DIM6/NTAB) family NADH-FMN oxidoreductase RutF